MRSARPAALLSSTLGALTIAILATTRPMAAEDEGPVPGENTSYVSADATWLREAVEQAEAALAAEAWDVAVRSLQQIVEVRLDSEHEGAAAPYVLPVHGSVVFEGAWVVAHHRILRAGVPALEAYAAEFGSEAAALLERGIARRDTAALADLVDRFLPLAEARRAALVLADLALEGGDRDGALAWLQRLQDVEEVSGEGAERLAPWQRARVARMAVALARPDRVQAVEAALDRAARSETPDALRYRPPPPADRPPSAPLSDWPTTGGGAARAGRPPALGASFELAWWRRLEGGVLPLALGEAVEGPRPSTWLPPRAVVAWPVAFVCDGRSVDVWDLESGRRRAAPVPLADARSRFLTVSTEATAREELGLLEGHALTLGPEADGGRMLYVAAPDPTAGAEDWGYGTWRDDHLVAFRWNGQRLERAWRAGGRLGSEGLEPGTRLYGAPLLYRGRLWIAGVRPSRGTDVQADAWLFGLSPATGRVEAKTYLGSGVPVRAGRPDEAIPSSPAGASGRVVVSTSLGIVAAVDARTGRPLWTYLNDRGVPTTGRPRRLGTEPDASPRQSGFVNQPPLLALEQVYVAPTDGPWLCCLFDRPRGPGRTLIRHRRDRTYGFHRFRAEQIAGFDPGGGGRRPALFVIGQGRGGEGGPPARIAVGLDLDLDPILEPAEWRAHDTSGHGAEPYGTALLTAGELFVPTRHGIGIHDLRDGRDVGTLDAGAIPPRWHELLPPDAPLFGNLVPVPGRGILALNGVLGAYWRIR